MQNFVLFLLFWAVNSLILAIVSTLFPSNYVLGTHLVSYADAAIRAGFWMTVILWILWPAARRFGLRLKKVSSSFLFFWAVNFVAIWLVARAAPVTGFGISRFTYAIYLGLGVNFFQWLVYESAGRPS